MSSRRVVVAATLLVLLAAGATAGACRPTASRGRGVAPPAGTLRFGDLMVLDRVETSGELAALQADCFRTRVAVGDLMDRLAASPVTTSARAALRHYLTSCGRYVVDIAFAQAVATVEQTYEQSYLFTGSIRASDGRVYTCTATTPTPAADGPPTCWTADRVAWPALAALVAHESRAFAARADFLEATGCPTPDLADVCAADVARHRATARSAAVFAEALGRGDTRVFTWLGVPPSVGVAEADAATDATESYRAACRAHGFADSSPTRYERDRLRDDAATIRAALAAGRPAG